MSLKYLTYDFQFDHHINFWVDISLSKHSSDLRLYCIKLIQDKLISFKIYDQYKKQINAFYT